MPIAGMPFDFMLFALTLLGVALFHARTLQVALTGAAAITLYLWLVTGSKGGAGLAGLLALLLGFFAMLLIIGWNPHPINERAITPAASSVPAVKQ